MTPRRAQTAKRRALSARLDRVITASPVPLTDEAFGTQLDLFSELETHEPTATTSSVSSAA